MSTGTGLFLDTSIQIARVVHGPDTKKRISELIEKYDLTVTSEVVLQEFKRRLLKEAQYLLNQFLNYKSYAKVLRHVVDILPPQALRKRNINLELLTTIKESSDDGEIAERAIRYLRTLIKCGLDDFESNVGSIVRDANCFCARQPIKQRGKEGSFDFGKNNCSGSNGKCFIGKFLLLKTDVASKILSDLKSLPLVEKTNELKNIESFLNDYIDDLERSHRDDPCLKVGDLVIAIESSDIPDFYTINARESKVLCKSLGQKLIVRPVNPAHSDQTYEFSKSNPNE